MDIHVGLVNHFWDVRDVRFADKLLWKIQSRKIRNDFLTEVCRHIHTQNLKG